MERAFRSFSDSHKQNKTCPLQHLFLEKPIKYQLNARQALGAGGVLMMGHLDLKEHTVSQEYVTGTTPRLNDHHLSLWFTRRAFAAQKRGACPILAQKGLPRDGSKERNGMSEMRAFTSQVLWVGKLFKRFKAQEWIFFFNDKFYWFPLF